MNGNGLSKTMTIGALAAVLYGVLGWLAVEISNDVKDIKKSMMQLTTESELTRQRVEMHSEAIAELRGDHKSMVRTVDEMQQKLSFWEHVYQWRKKP